MKPDADLLLVGGGLANGLLAWRLSQERPELRVLLLEAGATLGGNHTWSFHGTDLSPAQQQWLGPLIAHRWDCHFVRFPGGQRRLAGAYASVTSARFHEVLRRDLAGAVRTGVRVAAMAPYQVTLEDGSTLRAGAVVDGRGRMPEAGIRLGWQKFVGQEFRLHAEHGLEGPVLMDASVPQQGGYRFIYTLPLDARSVLVEDTAYADGAALDLQGIRRDIGVYLQAQGWRPRELLREEQGVLPIVLQGDPRALWEAAAGVPRTGLSAALFHPTTGYSLPDAVRLADLVCGLPDVGADALFRAIRAHALAQWRRQSFFRVLNRMLFQAAVPGERWRVMQRFYGLPEPLIARFYAGRPNLLDKLRIVSGRPPVPLVPAIRAAWGQQAPQEGYT